MIEDIQIHRWRYSQPSRLHDESFLVAKGVPNLVFAGDALQDQRLRERHCLGLSAAQAMIS